MRAIGMVKPRSGGPKKILRVFDSSVNICKIADYETCCEPAPLEICGVYGELSPNFGEGGWEITQGTLNGNFLESNTLAIRPEEPQHARPESLVRIRCSANAAGDQFKAIVGYQNTDNYLYAMVTVSAWDVNDRACGTLELHRVTNGIDTQLVTVNAVNIGHARLAQPPEIDAFFLEAAYDSDRGMFWARSTYGPMRAEDDANAETAPTQLRVATATPSGNRVGCGTGNLSAPNFGWYWEFGWRRNNDECRTVVCDIQRLVCRSYSPGFGVPVITFQPDVLSCVYSILSGAFENYLGSVQLIRCTSAGIIRLTAEHEPGAVRIRCYWEGGFNGDEFRFCYTDASRYLFARLTVGIQTDVQVWERVGGVDNILATFPGTGPGQATYEFYVANGEIRVEGLGGFLATAINDGTKIEMAMNDLSIFAPQIYRYHPCDPLSGAEP